MSLLKRLPFYSIVATLFFVPLAWFPLTFEGFEFPKQYVLFFFVALGITSWLARMIFVDKEIRLQRSPLDVPVAAVVGVGILSALFSVDTWSSVLGYYGRFSDNIFSLLALAGFYFLVTNHKEKMSLYLRTLFVSLGVSVLLAFLFLLGVFPFFVGPAQSMQGLAFVLAVFLVFLTARVFDQEKRAQLLHWALLAGSFVLLYIADVSGAWVAVLGGLLVLLVLELRFIQKGQRSKAAPLVFIGVLLLLSFVAWLSPAFSGNTVQREVLLPQDISWQIGLNTTTENGKNLLFGSGLGTFGIDFAAHRPVKLNEGPLWQFRFDRPGNFIAELVATRGFLGVATWFWLLFLQAMQAAPKLVNNHLLILWPCQTGHGPSQALVF